MNIVQVHVKVKKEYIQQFIEATKENGLNSIREPGIARFDLLQHNDNPQEFILNEIYKYDTAPQEHKDTTHYKKWRDLVADMMEEPRYSKKYTNLFPDDKNWS